MSPFFRRSAAGKYVFLDAVRRAMTTSGGVRGAMRDGSTSTRTSDRKSTRLNSSHLEISYAVFCLKKKQIINNRITGYAKMTVGRRSGNNTFQLMYCRGRVERSEISVSRHRIGVVNCRALNSLSSL